MARKVFSNNLTNEKISATFDDKYGYFEIDFVTNEIVCVCKKHSEYYKFDAEAEFDKRKMDILDIVVGNKNTLDLKVVNLITRVIVGRSKGVNRYINKHNLDNSVKSYGELLQMK